MARAIYWGSPPVLCYPAGASPLGEMLSAGELVSLSLAAANAGEDPLVLSMAGNIRSILNIPEPLPWNWLAARSNLVGLHHVPPSDLQKAGTIRRLERARCLVHVFQ